jgi:arabinofuranan 3-O-arabinosyltransferase
MEGTPETVPAWVALQPSPETAPEVAGDSSDNAVDVVSWAATRRVVEATTSDEDTWLWLPENYSAGWQATAGAQSLTAARLDGWAQGFLLPAGSSGAVTISFEPDRWYRWALAAGGLAVVLVALAAAMPARVERAHLSPARSGPGTVLVLAGALLWLGGLWLLVMGGLGLLVVRRVNAAAVAFVTTVLGGAVLALDPWPPPAANGGPAAQLLYGAAVAVLAAALSTEADVSARRWPRAIAGRSTRTNDSVATANVPSTVTVSMTQNPPVNGSRPLTW